MPAEFLRRDQVDLVLNMPHHGLEKHALVECLQNLVARQWLDVSLRLRDAMPPDDGIRMLASLLALSKEQAWEIRLSLTPAGGRAWENFAKPRWWAFISQEDTEVIDGRVHLVYRSPLRKTLEAFADMITYATILRGAPKAFTNLDSWWPRGMKWKQFHRGCEWRVDTGADLDSREGENFECNDLREMDRGLADIVMYSLWVWDMPFRFALCELNKRLKRRRQG